MIKVSLRVLGLAVASGLLYGLLARFVFGSVGAGNVFEIMSTAFIIGVPIALGFISVLVGTKGCKFETGVFGLSLILPWPAGLAFLFSTLLLLWEGLICIMLWLPLVLVLSSFGGLLGGIVRIYIESDKTRNYCLTFVAILPFVIAPLERLKENAVEIREVHSSIQIEASATVVWEEIRSVSRIKESEHRPALIHSLGFPRPLEAELIGDGVGAVRRATFEGDVLFIETITDWQPPHRIAFAIKADTENIPPDTFDEHVTIGGPYFDVLHGSYEIETIDDHSVLLHLRSRQRLSTGFNYYSHFWTSWLMDQLQTYILEIIKTRAERTVEASVSNP